MPAKCLRLILGDQLNADHSWFKQRDNDVIYLLAELKQETDYTRHHIQKIAAFFLAMQRFADALRKAGHRVMHLDLDQTEAFADLPALLQYHLEALECDAFEYQEPDEYRLAHQLNTFTRSLVIQTQCVDSEHFFLARRELPDYFNAQRHQRMESFYRKMRKRFSILMEGDQPAGGSWNYDSENRRPIKGEALAEIPAPLLFASDVSAILARVERHAVATIGESLPHLIWPTTREEARTLLSHFCEACLPSFGTYQDAMTDQSPHAWSLYHARLSFALNAKLISPHEVIDTATQHYHDNAAVSLPQIEGFVRQILGWREYVRGMYWVNMPHYARQNALSADRALPVWYWTGNTRMRCLSQAIGQSLETAYAHHIQRLMLTGNFALLAGIAPDDVDAWYLGIYVDAIEWVELPNTRGMALFADNGWIATKPYAASGNYVNKMSDHCRPCAYNVKTRTEEDSCPFNSLYWHFIDRHHARFKSNPRMAFPIKNWEKQPADEKARIIARADLLLSQIDSI